MADLSILPESVNANNELLFESLEGVFVNFFPDLLLLIWIRLSAFFFAVGLFPFFFLLGLLFASVLAVYEIIDCSIKCTLREARLVDKGDSKVAAEFGNSVEDHFRLSNYFRNVDVFERQEFLLFSLLRLGYLLSLFVLGLLLVNLRALLKNVVSDTLALFLSQDLIDHELLAL